MTNVVLIHTHDTGRYIEPYGYDVPTPTLQRLAEEGVLFRRAYSAAPTCSPSRGSLMTGQVPHLNGLIGLAHRGFEIDDYSQHLGRYLSSNGFETVLCGTEHESSVEGDARTQLGYEVLPEDPGAAGSGLDAPHEFAERDYSSARAAAAYIRDRGRGNRSRVDEERPYFLSLGLHNTHRPFPLEAPAVDPAYVRPPDPLPDVPAVREDMAGYATAVGFVDDCVEHVMGALEESGELEDTLVLFTTDHGIAFPSMKCSLRDGGIGVSLVARFPDGPAGEVCDALVSHLDLYPTLCAYLDLETPTWVQGHSLLPLLAGETDSVREEVFAEVTYHAAYEPKRCIRTDRYTYIRRFDDEHVTQVLPNVDDGPSKRFLLEGENGLGEREQPRETLYDHVHDPLERENLADRPAYSAIRADLADRLASWMSETNDPILEGPVSKPAGALADERGALHPDETFEEPNAR